MGVYYSTLSKSSILAGNSLMFLHLAPCFIPLSLFCVVQQEKVAASLSKDSAGLPAPTEEQLLAVDTLNGFRAIHGIEPVILDRRLIAASVGHAKSMSQANKLDHKGSKSENINALKRAEAFGYTDPVAELVASGLPSAPYAVVSFMDAPYHRRLLLKPGKIDFGCAQDLSYTCFVLGGSTRQQVVLSPPHSSDGVPTSWDGREEPSPTRGTQAKPPFGYPITLAAYGYDSNMSFLSANLASASGEIVPCFVKNPSNDTEAKNLIILLPKSPLKSKSIYTATAKFSLDGQDHSESWSFRTGSDTILAPKKKTKKNG